jgi:hypothetical protein
MRELIATLVILTTQALSLSGASDEIISEGDALAKGLLLVARAPHYPEVIEWRPGPATRSAGDFRRPTGTGIFDLRFDYETGHLREVRVVQSTGNRDLDIYSIEALKLWKAKPRALHILRVPITFRIPGR